nr:MAG TPA: hypothetical protein [Caudoviricetes sp.]
MAKHIPRKFPCSCTAAPRPRLIAPQSRLISFKKRGRQNCPRTNTRENRPVSAGA